jgi:hypothetical protein
MHPIRVSTRAPGVPIVPEWTLLGGHREGSRNVPRSMGNEKWVFFLIYRRCFTLHISCDCIKELCNFFNISLQNVEGKVGPKVFWLFVFGHFFCPFLKRGY